jgi:type IX secretion system PorP/SprF family membrane protein
MKKLLLGMMTCAALSSQAQDVHFTQYFTSPMTLNPALTGLVSCDWRGAVNYRSQWGAINNRPYVTATGSYDMSLLKGRLGNGSLGAGLLYIYDQSGTGQLRNNTFGLSLAYHHAFGDPEDKPTVLSIGGQGYLVNKSINFANLDFGDEYDPITGKPILPTSEQFNNRDLSYGDVNSGIMLTGYANERSTYYVGASYYHMTRPVETFLKFNNSPKINNRLSLSAGGNIQMNDNLLLLVSGLFQKQGPATELLLGAACGFIMNPMHDEYSNNTTLYIGSWYRLQDAISPYIGFEWGKSKLAFTYDVNVSSLAAATKGQGALEVSYIYNGCFPRNDTRRYNFACPRL